MNRQRLLILALPVAVLGALAAVLWPEVPVSEPDEPSRGAPQFAAHRDGAQGVDDVPETAYLSDESPLVPTSGQMLRFTLPATSATPAVEATIGVAGLWPPVAANAPGGGLVPLPQPEVSTFWGDEMSTYEVFARTVDRQHAYWGDVSTAELGDPGIKDVALATASPLEVTVKDEQGVPVADAEVRISRGFVGLVHLAKKTDATGKASFDGLPSGDFRVTVQAGGFARHMRHLLHSSANEAISLELEPGPTRIGNGELEQLADALVVDGNRTVVSTGEDEPGGEDNSERIRHPLDLYVVDRSGSPVSGALIQLWKGGQKLHEATSGGRTPVRVEVAAPFRGRLVAFDGRRGEGSVTVEVAETLGDHEFVVRLDRELLSLDLPPGRINQQAKIEDILGAELVRDNEAWLADVLSPSSPAARAGINRGDRVVYVTGGSGGYSALIERGNERLSVSLPAGP